MKNKKSKKNNTALPKADVEFAEERGNGLEKKALRAIKKSQIEKEIGQCLRPCPISSHYGKWRVFK